MSELLTRTEWDTESNFSVTLSAQPAGPSESQQHGVGVCRGQGEPTTLAPTFQVSTIHGNSHPRTPSRQKFGASRGQNSPTASAATFEVSTVRNSPADASPRPKGSQRYNGGISPGHHAKYTSANGMIILNSLTTPTFIDSRSRSCPCPQSVARSSPAATKKYIQPHL
jgi:hypothetical protein